MVVNSFIKCGTNIEGTFIQNSLIIKKDLLCRNLSLFVRIWRVWHRTKTKQKRFQIYFTWNKKKQLIIFRQLNTNYSTFVLNSPLTHFFTSPLLPCSTALLWYFSTVSQTSLVLWHCHAMWQCATLTLFYFSIVSLLHCSNSSNVAHAIASTFSQVGTSFVKTSSRYWLRHSWKPYHATGCVIRKTLVTLVTPRTRSWSNWLKTQKVAAPSILPVRNPAPCFVVQSVDVAGRAIHPSKRTVHGLGLFVSPLRRIWLSPLV